MIQLHHGDCLEIMPTLGKVDAVITDIPYGTTGNLWDNVIPFDVMWKNIKPLIDNGVFITTSSQPFTSKLIFSNLNNFKYEYIWNKRLAGNGILSNIQPLKIHENICVFAWGKYTYNPIMRKGKMRTKGGIKDNHGTFNGASSEIIKNDEYKPTSILDFSGAYLRMIREHPTQKPIELYEYLIETYTNENDTILDPFMGSGTTGVACVQTGRNFIGIEIDAGYFEIAKKRIEQAQLQMRMPI